MDVLWTSLGILGLNLDGEIMKLCFGSFARILSLNRVSSRKTPQRKLIKTLLELPLKNGVTNGDITDQTATRLLTCVDSVSPIVVNDAEKIIEEGNVQFVVENFNKRIIQPNLIKSEKENVIAIISVLMDIIERDNTLDGTTPIDKVNGTTKKALLSQGKIWLNELPSINELVSTLAGVLLYVVVAVSNKDKNGDYEINIIDESYMKSIVHSSYEKEFVKTKIDNAEDALRDESINSSASISNMFLQCYLDSLNKTISDAKLYFADKSHPSKISDVYVSLPIDLRIDLKIKDKRISHTRLVGIDENASWEDVDYTHLSSFLPCLNELVNDNIEYRYQDNQKRPKILAPTYADGEKDGFWELNGIDAFSIFDQLVILGEPGQGKSTLFKFFALKLMEQYNSTTNVFKNYSISNEFYSTRYIPVFIEIKELVSWYKERKLPCFNNNAMFMYLKEKYMHDWTGKLPHDGLFAYNCIYILDGLDEIAYTLENRNIIISLLRYVRGLSKERCKLLLSCRRRDFSVWNITSLTVHSLRLMDNFVATQLVKQIFDVQFSATPPSQLLNEINKIGVDMTLVGNPLFMSLIAQLFLDNQRAFPNTKSMIIKESILLLLKRKPTELLNKFHGGVADLFPALETISFEIQSSVVELSFKIKKEKLAGIICVAIDYCSLSDLSYFLASTTGLLSNVGENAYAFAHRHFQEYLCASYLFNQKTPAEAAVIIKDGLSQPKRIWSEIAILYLEMMYDYNQIDRIVETTKWLMAGNGVGGWVAWYIGKIIEARNYYLIDEDNLRLPVSTIPYLRELLLSAFLDVDSLPVRERVFCGKVLGIIGDPRRGVGLDEHGLPDILWCRIEAGTYKIGVNAEIKKRVFEQVFDDIHWGLTADFTREEPQSEIQLGEFCIAKYPVTIAQFNVFLDSVDGYLCRDNWTWSSAGNIWYNRFVRNKTLEQVKNQSGKMNIPNFPVTDVSWIEAVSFCRWLSNKTGETFRLPTEGEWEVAAKSANTIFTWGDEFDASKCNSSFSGIGDIAPVGTFSMFVGDGVTSEMNGNIWEWCCSVFPAWDCDQTDLSVYSENNNIVNTSNYNRLTFDTTLSVRGGSYINPPMFLRSSFRGRDKISLSFYRQGFRLVKEIVPHSFETSETLTINHDETQPEHGYFKEGSGALVSSGDKVRISYSVKKDGTIIEDMTSPLINFEVVLGKGQLHQEIDAYILANKPRISMSFEKEFMVFSGDSNEAAKKYLFYVLIQDRR